MRRKTKAGPGQGDLFSRPKSGEQLRDEGIDLVIGHNEDYKARFDSEAARQLAKNSRLIVTDITDVVGMPGGSRNAIGAAMRAFAVSHGLQIVGYRKSERAARHAGRIAVWGKS
jgi:hypothetical protein